MSDPFVAEIRIFPFNFAPKGWALCDGQLLPLSQNTALFSLLGTTYGGDGKSNFALPDLQVAACAAARADREPGLCQHFLGEIGGSASVTLLESEMPQSQPHPAGVHDGRRRGRAEAPAGRRARLAGGASDQIYAPISPNMVQLAFQSLAPAGSIFRTTTCSRTWPSRSASPCRACCPSAPSAMPVTLRPICSGRRAVSPSVSSM